MSTLAEPLDVADVATQFTVVRRRHTGRWLAAAVVAVLGVVVAQNVLSNSRFGWEVVGQYISDASIIRGLGTTLFLTVVCMAIGTALAVLLAVMRLSSNPVVNGAAFVYVSFFRGTPVLVQLLFWFNLAALYPVISFGIPGVHLDANTLITPMLAAIMGLALNEAAYMSEIVRAGILSVEWGQSDAASALGLTKGQTMRRIVLPQAMRVIVPPTGNETIGMLKTTALVSVIAVPELLFSSQVIYARNYETIPLLIVASLWYLAVTAVLGVGQYYIERHFARGNRNLPPTPIQRLRTFARAITTRSTR